MKTKPKKKESATPQKFSLRYAEAVSHAHDLALTLAKMTDEEIKTFGVLGTLNATFAENKVPYALLRTYRKEERAAWPKKAPVTEAKP